MNIKFAVSEKLGIRAFLPYRSTFNARARGDTTGALASQRVYRFKTSGESADTWGRLIEAAAFDLGCREIWVVPGHDPAATSQLQTLFGTSIRRKYETTARKYSHRAPVDIASFEFPKTKVKRVLLVDDVATSGKTLTALRDHLAGKGVAAVPLALGIHPRLCPDGFDFEPLTRQWQDFASAGKAEADTGPEMELLSRIMGTCNAVFTVPLTRPMNRDALNNCMIAGWDLPTKGLPWKCKDRNEQTVLQRLHASGLVKVEGRTRHVSVIPSAAAVFGGWESFGGDIDDLRNMAAQIEILCGAKGQVKTKWGMPITMGFQLVESAGPWWADAYKSREAWAAYLDELAIVHGRLIPLMTTGTIQLFVASDQRFWGVWHTGRGPDLDTVKPAAANINESLFDAAFAPEAARIVSAGPSGSNEVARMLPASKWF